MRQTGKLFLSLNYDLWFFLQPLDQIEYFVPPLKDLIHACLQPETEGESMTFKVSNIGSKYTSANIDLASYSAFQKNSVF